MIFFDENAKMVVGTVDEDENTVMDSYITIPIEEYRTLVEDSKEYETLVNMAIFGGELNYRETDLSINDGAVSHFLKAMQPHRWNRKLESLKKEKEALKDAEV